MAEIQENEGGYSPQNILEMIQKTKNKFGEIESVILCDIKNGKKNYCINGRHRLLINPNWKRIHLGELTLPEALNLRAIITLVKQPDSQKNSEVILEYCDFLKGQNCPKGQYVKKMFEGLDGAISKKTISKYVPDEFKIVTKPKGCGTSCGITPEQETETIHFEPLTLEEKKEQKENYRQTIKGIKGEIKKLEENEEDVKDKDESGYSYWGLLRALQRDIRRNNEEEALFWAIQLEKFNYNALWNRLTVMASEDVGVANPLLPVIIQTLRYHYEDALRRKNDSYRVFLSNAIIILCRSPNIKWENGEVLVELDKIIGKTRVTDDLLWKVYGEIEFENKKLEIPDYAKQSVSLEEKFKLENEAKISNSYREDHYRIFRKYGLLPKNFPKSKREIERGQRKATIENAKFKAR